MNEDLPIYDLTTKEHMPTVDRDVCTLVYCIDKFELPEIPEFNHLLCVEIYKVSSVEEALRNYIEEEGIHYNVGNNLLKHYDNMDFDLEEYSNIPHINIDFWLFRLRYHRKQPAVCHHAVEFAEIDVDHAQPLDTLLGHQVIGYDTWECSNSPECNESHEESAMFNVLKNFPKKGIVGARERGRQGVAGGGKGRQQQEFPNEEIWL
ncbi:hypothetical protein CONCODRAFT_73494 [Conidiobolus coronatus NRRL 28638]|uniref:Uncharacterized protein n=1 Tax=Conidiobolus coronatus (strain ATCC 28846 / CBS 209.66 / NRRL 28638) TaxID=796925 RepID=A0A137NVF3_CONC2|nr:hypothetical protein CONCODRAFT_73494 [Conidiobolus coronatus NRRL 28638]|eukprot:KXN66732.1 hypothetical protein CONCODRAFT_73494 [Conidiobolus coronatus NRRL 28638]